jgi:dolichyl-phosphate beta-glucosyltransferase
MPYNMTHLSVIIPAKNEAKHIQKTVQAVFDFLETKGFSYEIIVVSNNSTDGTAYTVKNMALTMPNLRLLDYPDQTGKGFAVREGMLQAQGEYRLFMDADNSTTIDNIDKFMPYLRDGCDVVIASIAVPGHEVVEGSEPTWRRLFGKLGNLYIQVLAVPGIHDTQRGFKMLTAKATQDIFSRSKINQFGFDIEILALAIKFGYKIKEVPVKWHNDPNSASHPRLSAYIQVLLDTLRIRRDLLFGRYK